MIVKKKHGTHRVESAKANRRERPFELRLHIHHRCWIAALQKR